MSDPERFLSSVHRDWESAELDEAQHAALALIVALNEPRVLSFEHFKKLSQAGVADREIEQVVQISAAFHIISRIADALEFEMPGDDELRRGARFLLKRGYN